MKDASPPSRAGSSTFFKGLQVLAAFDDDHPRLTLADIGQITGLDRAAVRRLIITLVDFGYVEKSGKDFTLRPKILTLTGSYMRANAIGTLVQPVLNKHSRDIGREISLAAASDTEAVYIARSTLTDSDISFGFTVGSRLPLLQTAIGRMLLATRDEDAMMAQVRTGQLRPYTPDSLMDRAAIVGDILRARTRGYALVSGEFEAGVAGLAVPIGPAGSAKSVIGLSLPMTALADSQVEPKLLSALHLCANALVRAQAGG